MKDLILQGILYGYALYRIVRVFLTLGLTGYESGEAFIGALIGAALTAVLCAAAASLLRRVSILEEKLKDAEKKDSSETE